MACALSRPTLTRLGLQIPSFSFPHADDSEIFPRLKDLARAGEEAGFDSIWVMDHFLQIPMVGDRTEPMFEAYTLLGALAVSTEHARLGTMVSGVTYRNPALLAKEVTALDVISGGRAVLGIGAAWYEQEHDALGFGFAPLKERFERLEEALQICRAMFREEAPSFEGRHYRIKEAANRPRPLQPGGPPILVGGGGERRTLLLVARYGDACNIFGDVETVKHKLAVLDAHCERVGRDPQEITRTRLGTMIIATTEQEARVKAAAYAHQRGMDMGLLSTMATIGGPDAVVEAAGKLFDAGLDGLVWNFPDPSDIEAVALAGETLSAAFGRAGAP